MKSSKQTQISITIYSIDYHATKMSKIKGFESRDLAIFLKEKSKRKKCELKHLSHPSLERFLRTWLHGIGFYSKMAALKGTLEVTFKLS